jgi:hypothetical protein
MIVALVLGLEGDPVRTEMHAHTHACSCNPINVEEFYMSHLGCNHGQKFFSITVIFKWVLLLAENGCGEVVIGSQ